MLIATQSQSVIGTQQYFELVLTQGDYYLGQEVAGQWHGKGAVLLGLEEGIQVTKEQFSLLLQGKHPLSGEQLTQRQRKDRRPGMDLTFSVPKSVSLLWAILGDERVIELLREAVRETMALDVEPLVHRRVRRGKHANSKQKTLTGKLIYADFLHKTSRPVDGLADPHLHIHAFVMNWTHGGDKHYAGEMEEIVRQRASLQAKFDARLARKLLKLGYGVTAVRYMQGGKLKRGWEIEGIWRSIIEKFSRRTAQIEEFADENGISDAAAKGKLGKLTREQKQEGQTVEQLRQEWHGRLTAKEWAAFNALAGRGGEGKEESERGQAERSVQYALDHHLYRQSTVERHQVVATALEHGLTLSVKEVEQTLDRMDVIERRLDFQGSERRFLTTQAVLNAERQLIAFARDGRGTRKAINRGKHEFARDWLNDHQKAAVKYVLHSRDQVMAVIGGAGTGKTSLMQEAVEAIQRRNKKVFTFAPSTGAKEVLHEKGFTNSQTVEHLIRNTKLHDKLKDQVVWIDEAGLLDVRSMNKVFAIAKAQNARVVLSGDSRQHASPRRGEAMRLLENEAGLKMARAEIIQRQKGKYRQAVALISKGQEIVDARTGTTGLLAGFDKLDAMGKIKEIPAEARHEQLAASYLKANDQGKSSLIVAPTHAEAQAVTTEIRSQLKQQGQLSKAEGTFTQYQSLNLTEAEKGDAKTYADQDGLIVQFHQNTKGGIGRGDRFRITSTSQDQVQLAAIKGEQRISLPLDQPERFEVYAEHEIRLAPGDKIRFSLGGTTKNKQGRISNGRLDELKGFDQQGNLVLKNGWVVDKAYAHLDLGYVITSHAAQGKDRDIAIAAMGSQSLPAINARQFYVTVSRGREDVQIYVDNKAKIRSAIQRAGVQLSATELVRSTASQTRGTTRERAREGRSWLQSWRDRVLSWWRGKQTERANRQAVGRHREASTGRGLSPFRSPSPGRSR